MARQPVFFVDGEALHVIQRGNNRRGAVRARVIFRHAENPESRMAIAFQGDVQSAIGSGA